MKAFIEKKIEKGTTKLQKHSEDLGFIKINSLI